MNENPEKVGTIDQYQLLEKQRRQLFEDLITSTELTNESRDFLLARVFEHSVEDGMELAEKWVSDKSVVIKSVITDDFVIKHLDFSLRLANRLQEYRNLVDKENVTVMNEFADTMSEQVTKLKQGTLTEDPKMKTLPETEVFLERGEPLPICSDINQFSLIHEVHNSPEVSCIS